MKKISFILALMVCGLTFAQAQVNFKPGDLEFSTGVGIFSTYAKDGAQTIVPPVTARLDLRVASNFSLGAFAAYSSSEVVARPLPDGTLQDLSNETTMFGLRTTAYSNSLGKWQVYGGLSLAYSSPNIDETINDLPKSAEAEGPSFRREPNNTMVYSAFIGSSYYPTKHIGLFGEVGYGISIVTVGMSAKL